MKQLDLATLIQPQHQTPETLRATSERKLGIADLLWKGLIYIPISFILRAAGSPDLVRKHPCEAHGLRLCPTLAQYLGVLQGPLGVPSSSPQPHSMCTRWAGGFLDTCRQPSGCATRHGQPGGHHLPRRHGDHRPHPIGEALHRACQSLCPVLDECRGQWAASPLHACHRTQVRLQKLPVPCFAEIVCKLEYLQPCKRSVSGQAPGCGRTWTPFARRSPSPRVPRRVHAGALGWTGGPHPINPHPLRSLCSVKDRIAAQMVARAEERGLISPDRTVLVSGIAGPLRPGDQRAAPPRGPYPRIPPHTPPSPHDRWSPPRGTRGWAWPGWLQQRGTA